MSSSFVRPKSISSSESPAALHYATRWTDPAVIAPTILPAWEQGTGPSPEPLRVGLASIWGRSMYPGLAQVVDTRTKKKSKAPHPTHGRGPRPRASAVGVVPGASRSHESKDGQLDAISDARESLECPIPTGVFVHAVPEAAQPLSLPYPTSEQAPNVVAVEAAAHLGAPDAGVGGAGGGVRRMGSAEGPILVDSDVDTDDESGESGGEPDGCFTVGPASASLARSGGRPFQFAG